MRRPLKIVRPWEPFAITFIGDPHLESPSHATRRFDEDMKRATDNGDAIWLMGDVFSAILPSDLKRSTASHRKASNASSMMETDDVLGELVNAAAERLKPYVNNIEVIMVGNHETAVLKYHHFDLIRALILRLNECKTEGVFDTKHIQHGGYLCWLQVQFKQTPESERTHVRSISQHGWIHHGAGGSAFVTKGLIDANRIKSSNWFDFGVIGHKHTQVLDRDRVTYTDNYGNIKVKDRDFAVVGGYSGESESEYDPMTGGYRLDWSEERFYANEAQGSVRVKFRPVSVHGDVAIRRAVEMPESM